MLIRRVQLAKDSAEKKTRDALMQDDTKVTAYLFRLLLFASRASVTLLPAMLLTVSTSVPF